MKIFKVFGIKNKKLNNINSPEFYKNHPDLAPRNVYLATGRVISREEIDAKFDRLFKLTLKDKATIWFNNLKDNLIKK